MQLPLYTNDDNYHSPKNEREAVLYYLSKMDMEMLELVLSDNRTYQDATKNVFLEKLSHSLSEFTAKGDSELKVLKGECSNDNCHKGCAGYAFVGNCSGFHLDFIVEGANNEILDMYYCSEFKAYSDLLDMNKKISINIKSDEEAAFKPSDWYLMTAHQCSTACDEIIRNDQILPVIDMQEAALWMEKHKELYSSVDPIFMPAAFSKFYEVYDTIRELIPVSKLKEEAERALQFYHNRVKKSKNKKILLCWLAEFEQLKDDLVYLYFSYFDIDQETVEDFVKINRTTDVYLCAEDFSAQLKFVRIYFNYYMDIYNKYVTIQEEEWIAPTEKSDDINNRSTLKYHLQLRGII